VYCIIYFSFLIVIISVRLFALLGSPTAARLSLFNPFLTLPRSVAWSHHAVPGPSLLRSTESSFVGLTAAENHGSTAGLKPESSNFHSKVDTLECLTAIIHLSQDLSPLALLFLAVASLLLLQQYLVIDYDSVS